MSSLPIFNLVLGHGALILLFYIVYVKSTFNLVEIALLVIGSIFCSWGQIYFTLIKKWRDNESDRAMGIWQGGPYRIVRHPFYGGMITICLAFISFFLRAETRIFLFTPFLLIIILIAASLRQERKLKETYGEKAEEYFSKVKDRWIPFIF